MKAEDLTVIRDKQARIDRYMEMQGVCVIRSTDPDILLLAEYDLSDAESMLLRWAERHASDSSIIGTSPLAVKVFGNDSGHDGIMFGRRKRKYAARKAMERKEWDEL